MSNLLYLYMIKLIGGTCITYGLIKAVASELIVEKFGFTFSIFLMLIVFVVGLLFMYDVFNEVRLIANSK